MSSLPVYQGQTYSFVGGKFEMLNESLYREIAGKWHGGQRSALYAFASTGTIQPTTSATITSSGIAPCETPTARQSGAE